MTRPGRGPSWWDRIQRSRHRRSILGSLAVVVLLVVVIVAGLFQGGGTRPDSSAPGLSSGVSRQTSAPPVERLRH